MKIAFIMNARIPTEKAHGYQIVKMCEALAREGAEVSLLLPTRKNEIQDDIFAYYSVEKNFSVRYLPTFDALSFFKASRIGFYFQQLTFAWSLRKANVPHDATIITRNPEVAWWYGKGDYKVYFDAHNFPERGIGTFLKLLKNVSGVICNSEGTARKFREGKFSKVLVAPNGVDLSQFEGVVAPPRNTLGLPSGRIVMYVGHLYGWKGVDVVVEAARRVDDTDLIFVFLGGTEKDVAQYREKTKNMKNVIFLGHRSRSEMPSFLKSAGVLVLPNVPTTTESISYTSPIKMFEYMASGVPIVASDLPSIREVLNDGNAILVPSGSPETLLAGIAHAFTPETKVKSAKAAQDVKKYTWEQRAKNILRFISAL